MIRIFTIMIIAASISACTQTKQKEEEPVERCSVIEELLENREQELSKVKLKFTREDLKELLTEDELRQLFPPKKDTYSP